MHAPRVARGLLLLSCLVACGDGGAGPDGARLSWSPGAAFPSEQPAVVRTLQAEPSVVRPSSPGAPLVLGFVGPFDPAAFGRVRVVAAAAGVRAEVQAALLRGGALLGRSPTLALPLGDVPAAVDLDLPAGLAARGPSERLELRVSGELTAVTVASVELLAVPPAARLPDPREGAVLVALDGDARAATGLLAGVPLVAEAPPMDDALLSFSWARPAALPLPDGARLVVLVGGRRHEVALDRTEPGRWHAVRLPLGAVRGVLSVAVEPEGGGWGLLLGEAALLPASPEDGRLVLLVTADTHRGDHLGAAARPAAVATPALDALAAQGVLFEDCYAPTNFTNPSHAALMTGTHPRDVGLLDNTTALADAAPTLAEAFAAAGWATWAAVSARHLGHDVGGLGQGFDRMSWPLSAERASEHTLAVLRRWLDEPPDRPLFVWLHVFDAHRPYDPPPEFAAAYPAEDEPRPAPDPRAPAEWTPDAVAAARASYKALVSYSDDQLLSLLQHPRVGQAVVAVVGDHGESFGEHGYYFDHGGLHPGTLHVPLLLRWPGAPAGRRVESPVQHTDLAATLLALAGVQDAAVGGRDLRELLERPSEAPRFALAAHGTAASVTAGGLHLVLHLTDHHGWRRHEVELYDLGEDPAAAHDVSAQRPQDTLALHRLLVRWLLAARPAWAGGRSDDPAALSGLAALGYLDAGDPGRSGPLFEPDDCESCRRLR